MSSPPPKGKAYRTSFLLTHRTCSGRPPCFHCFLHQSVLGGSLSTCPVSCVGWLCWLVDLYLHPQHPLNYSVLPFPNLKYFPHPSPPSLAPSPVPQIGVVKASSPESMHGLLRDSLSPSHHLQSHRLKHKSNLITPASNPSMVLQSSIHSWTTANAY